MGITLRFDAAVYEVLIEEHALLTFDLMERYCLKAATARATVTDAAEASAMPVVSISRTFASLETRGYVQMKAGRMCLSPSGKALANRLEVRQRLSSEARRAYWVPDARVWTYGKDTGEVGPGTAAPAPLKEIDKARKTLARALGKELEQTGKSLPGVSLVHARASVIEIQGDGVVLSRSVAKFAQIFH